MKKLYYSISEVCNLLDLKPHIIRYWETEFPELKPPRTRGDTRRYTYEKIQLLKRVKDMLYVQKFTIQGVKNRLSQMKSEEKYRKPIDKGLINNDLKDELIDRLSRIKKELDLVYLDNCNDED